MRKPPPGLCALLLAGAVVACTRNLAPPMLTVGDRPCATTPDLAMALPLALQGQTKAAVNFNTQTPCLQPAAGRSRLYAVFALPISDEPFWLSVMSVVKGQGVVAPHLALLDENGTVMREIPQDRFMLRGNSLQFGVRPQPGERFLLATSDPDAVGQQSDRIMGSTNQAAVPVGTGGYLIITSGQEAVRTLTRAHGGQIVVAVERLAKPADSSTEHPTMSQFR
jgi:hypothetical protein